MKLAQKEDYQFRVLAVDDDPVILSLLKEVMSMVPGCQVVTASQPSEAMKEIVRGDVDIVFTDVHMPGVTGVEMIRDIIALEKSPEIIVMTAYPSGQIAQEVMELGVVSLLSKPFENIAVVEAELEKAVKRVLRQRTAKKGLAELKLVEKPDPVEILMSEDMPPVPDVANPISMPALEAPSAPRQLYAVNLLDSLVQIEVARCVRYQRQFVIFVIDPPETFNTATDQEQKDLRVRQIAGIEACLRKSDVIFDGGRDGIIALCYECNRLGAEVVEHKLVASGFKFTGFSVYPANGQDSKSLLDVARQNLQVKRKYQLVLFEQEEFFGQLVQNMLVDPKYEITWLKDGNEAFQHINRNAEHIRIMILSLARSTAPWELIARLIKENLVCWPILLFVDIPLKRELREKVRSFGIRAVVHKSTSQEEFLYIVQSFVLPKPPHEERKNFRALSTLPVRYVHEGKEFLTTSFTLSRDGVFIRDMNPPVSGSLIDVEVLLPETPIPVKAKAEVLYVVPYFIGVNRFHVAGMAVRFLNLETSQKDRIENIVLTSRANYLL